MPNEMLLPLKGWMIKKASRVYTTGRQGLFEGTGLKISYFFFKKKAGSKGPGSHELCDCDTTATRSGKSPALSYKNQTRCGIKKFFVWFSGRTID